MSDPKYIQHFSGKGAKWKVDREDGDELWICYACRFPKGEYVLCDPPEKWVDVTEGIREANYSPKNAHPGGQSGAYVKHGDVDIAHLICGGQYRLRKVRAIIEGERAGSGSYQSAFVVERKP